MPMYEWQSRRRDGVIEWRRRAWHVPGTPDRESAPWSAWSREIVPAASQPTRLPLLLALFYRLFGGKK